MGEVGKFVILDRQQWGDPLDTFGSRREFDDMFNETYNDIEHALLWTDTIARRAPNYDYRFPREELLQYATDPVSLHDYRDRLASFPKNLKYVAKKMALYFYDNGVSLESMPKIQGFNPIVAVVILAVLHCFLIETEHDDIFSRIYRRIKPAMRHSAEFEVFFRLIDKFNVPHGNALQSGSANFSKYLYRIPIYDSIAKAANQLSTMMGLSGFLNNESPQFDRVPQEQRQELIALLQDASKKVRIYARIEDGPESPPSEQAMSMLGSQPKSIQVMNAEADERIRSKIASRYSRRGGKRRKSSNHTQRRKKNGKRFKRTMKH